MKIARSQPRRLEVQDGGQQAGSPQGLCPRNHGPTQAGEPVGDDLRSGSVPRKAQWLLKVRVLHSESFPASVEFVRTSVTRTWVVMTVFATVPEDHFLGPVITERWPWASWPSTHGSQVLSVMSHAGLQCASRE